MEDQTEGAIRVVDHIIAAGITNCIFGLIGGQPIIILGGTGPFLIFTEVRKLLPYYLIANSVGVS